jgi:hypothetical protein
MASRASIARRRVEALARMTKVETALADVYGIEMPAPTHRVRQPELQQVLDTERLAGLLESILMVVAPGGADEASDALAATVLDGTVGDIKTRLASVDTVPALEALRSAEEARDKPRAGVLNQIEKRIGELEADAEADEGGEE